MGTVLTMSIVVALPAKAGVFPELQQQLRSEVLRKILVMKSTFKYVMEQMNISMSLSS